MTISKVSGQTSGVQSQEQLSRKAHSGDSRAIHPFQAGAGGLQGYSLALGGGLEANQLLELSKEEAALLGEQNFGSPFDDPSFSFVDQIEILNRDQRLHAELKQAVSERDRHVSAESQLRSEMFQQLDNQIETNRLPGADETGEIRQPAVKGEENSSREAADRAPSLVRDSSHSEEFLQAAKALRERSRGTSSEWILLKSQASLEEAKLALAKLKVQIQETHLSEEDKAPLQARLELVSADVAKWELRLDTLNARMASVRLDEARPQDVVAAGNGEKRAETLSWSTRAKNAFTAFFQPVASGLASLGRFVVELPQRIWAYLTMPKERMGGEVLNAHLNAFLNETPGEKELKNDRKPAGQQGNARHICHGMAKDLPRMHYSIGMHNVGKTGEETGRLVERAATALMDLCEGDERLCMDVSYFAFQNIVGFQTHSTVNGWFTVEGASGDLPGFMAEEPKDKKLSISRLPDGSIHMLYELENRAMKRLNFLDGRSMELDPDGSVFTTQFAFVVSPRNEGAEAPVIKPYPLNPGSGDDSAVAYVLRVKAAADQSTVE